MQLHVFRAGAFVLWRARSQVLPNIADAHPVALPRRREQGFEFRQHFFPLRLRSGDGLRLFLRNEALQLIGDVRTVERPRFMGIFHSIGSDQEFKA